MLFPQLSTMLGTALFLECRVGVCNEFFNFVLSRKASLPTYSDFLRMDILGILLPRMITTLTLYFVSPSLNFMQFAIACFMNFLRGLFHS